MSRKPGCESLGACAQLKDMATGTGVYLYCDEMIKMDDDGNEEGEEEGRRRGGRKLNEEGEGEGLSISSR